MTLSKHIARAAFAAVLLGWGASADAADRNPVVVELFTSQGCSSCPPANANLVKLAQRRDVLALSFSVTYWDRLGWKDVFGKPEFTERQAVYEPALGERGPFTPQMVVNGRASAVGQNLSEIEGLIASAARGDGPAIALTDREIRLGAGKAPSAAADVWLVRYDPNVVNVAVRRGENSGRTLPHSNVVHDLSRLGRWDGTAISLALPRSADRLRTAVLVQAPRGGPILAAATD